MLDGVRGLAIVMVLLIHFVAHMVPTNGALSSSSQTPASSALRCSSCCPAFSLEPEPQLALPRRARTRAYIPIRFHLWPGLGVQPFMANAPADDCHGRRSLSQPTLELRIADVCTRIEDAICLAALIAASYGISSMILASTPIST